jgi:hypothetical protein
MANTPSTAAFFGRSYYDEDEKLQVVIRN